MLYNLNEGNNCSHTYIVRLSPKACAPDLAKTEHTTSRYRVSFTEIRKQPLPESINCAMRATHRGFRHQLLFDSAGYRTGLQAAVFCFRVLRLPCAVDRTLKSESSLVGALSPVKHRGLHQGLQNPRTNSLFRFCWLAGRGKQPPTIPCFCWLAGKVSSHQLFLVSAG